MLGESVIRFSVLCALLCSQVATFQIPLHDRVDQQSASVDASEKRPRQLNGRFLQITDFHPDRFYKVYSSTSSDNACHRGDGPAGVYGAETSECDSPISLINATFDWIKAELKDSIDFVIWTGDSARHDNDEKFPRSVEQVVGLNKLMVEKVLEVFGKPDNDDDDDDPTNDLIIPVVPTFGNNDILPHNIFEKGPNKWTRQYLSLWRKFIPEEQRHQFEQGGWFYVEVIPNNLAVFSLNSLYFFDSNSAVDGCAAKSEPGYRQMEWLRIQLQFVRDRGMKAIMIGHVPPARTENKHSWDESCWQKYALWMHQYRDVIVGSMYGHMNLDHFMLQDFEDVSKDVKRGYEISRRTRQDSIHINDETLLEPMASGNYLLDLRADWSTLPQPPSKKAAVNAMSDETRPHWEIEILLDDHSHNLEGGKKKHKGDKKPRDYWEEIGGKFAERFSVSFAAPSVVPNYFPSLRLYTFNATGLDIKTLHVQRPANAARLPELSMEDLEDWEDWVADNEDVVDVLRNKKKKKKKNHNKKQRFTVPKGPSDTALPGPAYSPQALSLLGLTQYYANLTLINNDYNALRSIELDDDQEQRKWKEGKHKKHNGVPHDKDHNPHPQKFKYEVLYDTHDDKVYNMTDLTMPSFLDLARRIGKSAKSKGLDLELAVGENAQGDYQVDEHENTDLAAAHVTDLADEDESFEGLRKKKKKGKKGRKKKHHIKRNKAWLAFVRRAFVGTISDEEVEESYGS
ncbi:hypothetical protein BDV97DRAFT_342392 [Delphinella strobiligena]|nr:hypothetical protein BDV97DRAFT_342392 [Delphinella strobiligena]